MTYKTYESTHTHQHRHVDAHWLLHTYIEYTPFNTMKHSNSKALSGWLPFLFSKGFVHFTAVYKQYIALVMWNKTWTILLLTNQQGVRGEGWKNWRHLCARERVRELSRLLSLNFILPLVFKLHSRISPPFLLVHSLTHSLVHPAAVHLPSSFLFMWLDSFLLFGIRNLRKCEQHNNTYWNVYVWKWK